MSSPIKFIAGIDGGGTTFKCGVATADGHLLTSRRFPTTTPEATLSACADYFRSQCAEHGATLSALGVACFGPLDVNPTSPDYGMILNSPKTLWRRARLREPLATALGTPVVVNTDVNGALLAEQTWGAARNVGCAAYITVGTGIGGAVMIDERLVGAPRHQELGHIPVKRHASHASFTAVCPIHGDCLEGLASAPAFTRAFGDPVSLDPQHPGWEIEAFYLVQACLSLSLSFRTNRIILGGGLMLTPHLLDRVRKQYAALQNDFLGETEADIAAMIVRPTLGDDAGLMGGIALAMSAQPG